MRKPRPNEETMSICSNQSLSLVSGDSQHQLSGTWVKTALDYFRSWLSSHSQPSSLPSKSPRHQEQGQAIPAVTLLKSTDSRNACGFILLSLGCFVHSNRWLEQKPWWELPPWFPLVPLQLIVSKSWPYRSRKCLYLSVIKHIQGMQKCSIAKDLERYLSL